MGARTIHRWVVRFRADGTVVPLPKGGGWQSPILLPLLHTLIAEAPDATCAEFCWAYTSILTTATLIRRHSSYSHPPVIPDGQSPRGTASDADESLTCPCAIVTVARGRDARATGVLPVGHLRRQVVARRGTSAVAQAQGTCQGT